MRVDPDLDDRISSAILGGPPAGTDETPDHLELVRRAVEADEVIGRLLHQSVASARAHGHSWAAIGNVLGLSRQAVQQRFGASVPEPKETRRRKLGPVTAFDELPELELAGRQGWRTVDAGILYHLVERTDTQWETRRVLWRKPASAYEQGGWEVAVRAFPWLYLVRDLGIPPVE